MENYFSPKMASKSSTDLEQIIESKEQFTDEAVLACLRELKKRNLLLPKNEELLDQLELSVKIEKKRIKDTARRKERETREFTKLLLDFLTFRTPSKIVPIVVYLNIFMYIAMLINGIDPMEPTPYDLLLWGGNLTELSFGHQPWRLVSYIFLHGSIIHILMNIGTLIIIGPIVEMAVGRKWFVISYFLTGVGAGVASAYWNINLVSVGASGSIFGLFGLTFSILITSKEKVLRRAFIPNILLVIGYSLVYGLLNTGIDNAAHIGGLISGVLFGFLLKLLIFRNESILQKEEQAKFFNKALKNQI